VRTVEAADFEQRCLAVLDEVVDTGELVTILRNGEPVARLMPPVPVTDRYPQRDLAGTVEFLGDVVEAET
jgi:prevent-host-death family protein